MPSTERKWISVGARLELTPLYIGAFTANIGSNPTRTQSLVCTVGHITIFSQDIVLAYKLELLVYQRLVNGFAEYITRKSVI